MESTQDSHNLPAIGFVTDLEDDARERLAAAGQFITRPLGARLSIQGRQHHGMALILSGRVAVDVTAHGDRIRLGVLGRGDVVGEMSVIDPRVSSSSSRVVSGPAQLWTIERYTFDQFIEDNPQSGLILLKALGKVLCRRVRKDSDMMLSKADEMRVHFLDIDY